MSTLYEIEQWARRRHVTFEVWHDVGHNADRCGNDPYFPLDPVSPASPTVLRRPQYGQQTLIRVYTGDADIPVTSPQGVSFLVRALTDPASCEFGDHTSSAAVREVSRGYVAVAPRLPQWGDVIVTVNEFGRLAYLIHAVWPITDDPDAPKGGEDPK